MIRRLYYLFPDVDHAGQAVSHLLLKRINFKNMHVVAREDIPLGDLPEASIFLTKDIRHSIVVGLIGGALVGVGAGIAIHIVLEIEWGGVMIGAILIGALLGAWASSMIGMMIPNKDLDKFQTSIENGDLLLVLDVHKNRVDEIEASMKELHPEARFEGMEPKVPSFP